MYRPYTDRLGTVEVKTSGSSAIRLSKRALRGMRSFHSLNSKESYESVLQCKWLQKTAPDRK